MQAVDLRWFALVGAIAYALAIPLVGTQADTDPVGADYDAFNRVLTVALAILAVSAAALRSRVAGAGLAGRRAATALAAGFALMALGSAIEFWGSLIAGLPTEKTAARTGADDTFVGSGIGWGVFLLGSVAQVGGALALARAARRWPGAGRTVALAAVAVAVLSTAAGWLWAVSPLAAAVPAVLFGFAWLAVASAAQVATQPAATARPPAAVAAR